MRKRQQRILLLMLIGILISGCDAPSKKQHPENLAYTSDKVVHVAAIDTSTLEVEKNMNHSRTIEEHPLFRVDRLSDSQIEAMTGTTWTNKAPISLDELRSVKVTYWGFDGEAYVGNIMIHKDLAEDIRDVFKELYEGEFPLEEVKPIYHYDGDDNASMEANNTSAFNYREMTGSTSVSVHAYGRAIDINPKMNPYIKGERILPESGESYTNREEIKRGMITTGDLVYQAFVKRGWTWGGNWRTLKDYQHFEKKE